MLRALAVGLLMLSAGPGARAEDQDIAAGRAIFRASCVRCHGADARGFTGPDLTVAIGRAGAAELLPSIIKRGVPGTDMPASPLLSDGDIARVIGYLRSLGPSAAPVAFAPRGDATRGEQVFWGRGACGSCHHVNGRGGRLGPDLSRGLASGTTPAWDAAVAAIRRPSETMTRGYVTVSVVTRDGQRARGIRKNEDTFSVQMLDTGERLRGFLKSEVREVVVGGDSLMPPYGVDRLSDAEVDDVIRYLAGLRDAASRSR